MRSLMTLAALVALVALLAAAPSGADPVELRVNAMPQTVHTITLDDDDFDRYTRLARSIGLEYGRVYGYREWADAKRANRLGIAGAYEWLAYSTGGDPERFETDRRAQQAPVHWESLYYSNIDMTIIHQVTNDGARSHVKLLKLARGRVPDLHSR